jgi:hypothetical protein
MQEREESAAIGWPALTGASRPWTRWWWLGSAVDEAEIARQLQLFQQAGMGGVEISPIYSVEGEEARAVAFLSPRWIELLRYTVREARRLGLDVDLICGTGWPLGGPWVADQDAAARVVFEVYTAAAGERVAAPIRSSAAPAATLCALMAFAHDGQALDLLPHVDEQRRLRWSAPDGQWSLYALFQIGTGQQVKRAAPGGEGSVVDHFSAAAIARYLIPIEQALADAPDDEQVRCLFNDSYEVYEANWTPELVAQFQRRRGYDLRDQLAAFCGQADPDLISRVRCDYRQTIAELLLEALVQPWTAWAHRLGARTRNQAHGAPGNLLDLYAAADIPETETFGADWLSLAGLEPLPGTPAGYGGRADILVGKLASSAAHVAGRPLCSSEVFTWLGEHGQTPLAHMKAELDLMFVSGVNHVFFHGTPFSPAAAAWPGWMFYASTHVAPSNPFWRDLPALNSYIRRCQSWLQAGQPDNDLLLYLPIFDLWATDQHAEHLLHFLTVHAEQWLDQNLAAFVAAARQLWDRGYSFDLVSDRLLAQATDVAAQRIQTGGATYRALVVAGCTLMPPETLERIVDLARAGATVAFVGDAPHDVPGLADLTQRRQRFQAALAALGLAGAADPGVTERSVGAGRLLIGTDAEALLERAGIQREQAVDHGIELIRRRDEQGALYFLVNLSRQRLDQWISLSLEAAAASLCDPVSQRRGAARSRTLDGATQVYLQLEPGESVLLRTHAQPSDEPPWLYVAPAGSPHAIEGPWRVDFIAGGPVIPAATTIERLTSWSEWPGDSAALRAFSGTARYTIVFEKPAASADAWLLDLGAVCYSARVTLNGRPLATCYARPFQVLLTSGLRDGRNELEIEVTNLMANRLAELDRRGEDWRRFFFVTMQYEPFDAAGWEPLPSGLLGPVQLTPLRQLDGP